MKERIKNLDGLRFLAALTIILSHIEGVKGYFHLPQLNAKFFITSGQLILTAFFVLSGYLIAWFLLEEKRKSGDGKIDIWHFYKKRLLRIWPLYYLLLLFSFLLFSRFDFFLPPGFHTIDTNPVLAGQRFRGYLFCLPNYTDIKYGYLFHMGQTWTLAVEEFFYLFFPIAILLIPYKKIPLFLFCSIILFILVSLIITGILYQEKGGVNNLVFQYVNRYRLYAFCCGAFVAYYNMPGNLNEKITSYFKQRWYSHLTLLTVSIIVIGGFTFSYFTHPLFSLLFAFMIFIMHVNQTNYRLLNNKPIIYLGKISYGIYMFQPLVIGVVLQLVQEQVKTMNIFSSVVLTHGLVLAFTILLSALSYELFEKYFLKIAHNKKSKTIV